MLYELKSENIENVMLFVCDSLRWDYIPESILNMGLLTKTVASSLFTASSFPSIISGLYPPKTGVLTWDDTLPINMGGLLQFSGYNTSLWCETTWTNLPPDKSAIHTLLGNPKGVSLEDIKPPFIYIEDDKGGHCPYGFSFDKYRDGGCTEFFKEYGRKGRKELIVQYKKGVEQSAVQFKKRIETLKERGLIESTLIIFTSDHGELLGEYGGLTNHQRPSCPELVYVPTVFIHPSLKPDSSINRIISHVDLYPTIASILNKKIMYETDGVDLTTNSSSDIILNFRFGGYYRSKSKIKNLFNYETSSAWDFNGGHIFHGLSGFRGLSFFGYRILIQKHPEFVFLLGNLKYNCSNKLRDLKNALKHLTSPHIKYMRPQFSKHEAIGMIENYLEESKDFKEKILIKSAIMKFKKGIKIDDVNRLYEKEK